MKIYDQVKNLLINKPKLRDSDRELIWEIWRLFGIIGKRNPTLTNQSNEFITKKDFMDAPHPETIRRARAKIQAKEPQLKSSPKVEKKKQAKAKQKGTHIFRESKMPKDDNWLDKMVNE